MPQSGALGRSIIRECVAMVDAGVVVGSSVVFLICIVVVGIAGSGQQTHGSPALH